jgi:hypothetical protein
MEEDGMELADATRVTAAILLVSLVTVESGGAYLLRVGRGTVPATPFQASFARAGHAHAGVLLVLGLVGLLYADATALTGLHGLVARGAVPAAALAMPAGFFFSSLGEGVTRPNRWIALVYVGAASLAVGLLALAAGLIWT